MVIGLRIGFSCGVSEKLWAKQSSEASKMGKKRWINGSLHYTSEREREEIAKRAQEAGQSVNNYLRGLAGLEPMRGYGGVRENAGWRWCVECMRSKRKRRSWKDARVSRLCQECWQRAADGEEIGGKTT